MPLTLMPRRVRSGKPCENLQLPFERGSVLYPGVGGMVNFMDYAAAHP